MEDRKTYLLKRTRWLFLLMMRGLSRGDTRNAERMKKAHAYRDELQAMGVDPDNEPLFSQEDLDRMKEWSSQSWVDKLDH